MAMNRMAQVVAVPSHDAFARVEDPPAELVTFLFTDIEGSSVRWPNPCRRALETSWLWFDHFALLAAAGGRIDAVARLAGYGDAMLAAHECIRQPNGGRAGDSLEAMLANKLRPEERARLMADGTLLGEDEACRIVTSICRT